MATFEVKVVEVSIEPHDNADALEIANIKGYQCIVRKGEYQTGDTAIYIPEQALVPKAILQEMNLWDDAKGKGKLAGTHGDRVKAVKLRGKLSQGLLYPNKENLPVGTEVGEQLGIEKWEPVIPTQLAGKTVSVHGYTLKYDIENIKNHPEVVDFLIENGVEVQLTEKIHGTWCCIGFYPEPIHPELYGDGDVVITSKGLSKQGLVFKNEPYNNERNLYVKTYRDIFAAVSDVMHIEHLVGHPNTPVFFLGEIFGRGVQDLTYGFNDIQYRLFDIFVGYPRENMGGRYLTPVEIRELTELFETFPNLSHVPVLYEGPLTREVIDEYTNGMDTLNGHNVREGVIIKPYDRHDISFGELDRVILKSVSEKYLTRKGGTEFN